jgi:hypothetical protein
MAESSKQYMDKVKAVIVIRSGYGFNIINQSREITGSSRMLFACIMCHDLSSYEKAAF